MPTKLITKTCNRCGETLPRDSFADVLRSDSGTTRLDPLCKPCRAIFDDEREAHRRKPNTAILCECGCGKPTNLAPITDEVLGWTRGQPMRFLRGHGLRKEPYPTSDYVVDPETGCWNWQLGIDGNGYGKLSVNGEVKRAHRVYFENRYGPLPEGMVPDHRCPSGPNRACVNPEHMFATTEEENTRWKRSTKLTWRDVATIRLLALQGELSQDAIAERFGITQAQIWRIIKGERWAA